MLLRAGMYPGHLRRRCSVDTPVERSGEHRQALP